MERRVPGARCPAPGPVERGSRAGRIASRQLAGSRRYMAATHAAPEVEEDPS